MAMQIKDVYGYGKDVLTILVIPAVGFLIKLHSDKAVLEEQVGRLEQEVAALRADHAGREEVEKAIEIGQENAQSLARVEQKLDDAIIDIRDLAQDLRNAFHLR